MIYWPDETHTLMVNSLINFTFKQPVSVTGQQRLVTVGPSPDNCCTKKQPNSQIGKSEIGYDGTYLYHI